jgi:myosin heavy subunit
MLSSLLKFIFLGTERIKKEVFKVGHFVEFVTYDSNGFLMKNMEKINPAVQNAIKLSDDSVIECLFVGM